MVVLSNQFPYMIRNANSGKPADSDTAFFAATQTIYVGKQYPSKLTLLVK